MKKKVFREGCIEELQYILNMETWHNIFLKSEVNYLQKLPVVQLIKNVPTFYRTRRFITMFSSSIPPLPIRATCPAHLILHDLIILIILCKKYEAPHYSVFSNLVRFHPCLVQTFSSVPCSQTPSVCVPQCQSPSFTPVQYHRQNYSFVYYNFYVSRQQTRR
jgi:hypothetical protein